MGNRDKIIDELSLSADFDGLTVSEVKQMLDKYPDDAVLDIVNEPVYMIGGWSDNTEDRILIKER